ncbi:unnamed protein product [Vitrella brassicaformis CCMP3155]|uniref:Uncharacterized protein n=1 Tax=Vitrella brassicaformis (strain CCMP3155) TaxID=1169540 RepID=A0A0G4EGY6_VITBC|nr:unnamed protein product [Vitrella brassicaformis CCMP3155]|eukprot:CEL94770.1 unnamed protein product [Vitrella brassicaformis CCMP3155]
MQLSPTPPQAGRGLQWEEEDGIEEEEKQRAVVPPAAAAAAAAAAAPAQSFAGRSLDHEEEMASGGIPPFDRFSSDEEVDSPFPTPPSSKGAPLPRHPLPLRNVRGVEVDDELDSFLDAEEDVGAGDNSELVEEPEEDAGHLGRDPDESRDEDAREKKKQLDNPYQDANEEEGWELKRRTNYALDSKAGGFHQVDIWEKQMGGGGRQGGGKKWRQLRVTTSAEVPLVETAKTLDSYPDHPDDPGNRRRRKWAQVAVDALLWMADPKGSQRPQGWEYGGTDMTLSAVQAVVVHLIVLFLFIWPTPIIAAVLRGLWIRFLQRVGRLGEDSRHTVTIHKALLWLSKKFAETYWKIDESLWRALQMKLHIGWPRLQVMKNLITNKRRVGMSRWVKDSNKPQIVPSKTSVQEERARYLPRMEEEYLPNLDDVRADLPYARVDRSPNEHFSSTYASPYYLFKWLVKTHPAVMLDVWRVNLRREKKCTTGQGEITLSLCISGDGSQLMRMRQNKQAVTLAARVVTEHISDTGPLFSSHSSHSLFVFALLNGTENYDRLKPWMKRLDKDIMLLQRGFQAYIQGKLWTVKFNVFILGDQKWIGLILGLAGSAAANPCQRCYANVKHFNSGFMTTYWLGSLIERRNVEELRGPTRNVVMMTQRASEVLACNCPHADRHKHRTKCNLKRRGQIRNHCSRASRFRTTLQTSCISS